jgi:hypothetical protein
MSLPEGYLPRKDDLDSDIAPQDNPVIAAVAAGRAPTINEVADTLRPPQRVAEAMNRLGVDDPQDSDQKENPF